MRYLVFTNLSGTLLQGTLDDLQAPLPTLAKLNQLGIPVISVTGQTRPEVEPLLQRLGLQGPFIVEDGSAIYLPRQQSEFDLPEGEDEGPWRVVPLGCNYVTARAGLRAMAQALGRPLKGFGDWSVDQVAQFAGLSAEAAKRAKAREFSEPFLTPKNVTPDALDQAAEAMGFQVVRGDRFSHLIGQAAGRGKAVRQLVGLYRGTSSPGDVVTLGLGSSLRDLPMLAAVDYPIVVPMAEGPQPRLAEQGWRLAPTTAPEGWALGVETLLTELGRLPG